MGRQKTFAKEGIKTKWDHFNLGWSYKKNLDDNTSKVKQNEEWNEKIMLF
jgi:hypothetical protein